jgi:hypothetical protein
MPHPRLPRKGKRQRFYARNAVKTTLDPCTAPRCSAEPRRLTRSNWALRANPSYQTRIYPALTSFAFAIGQFDLSEKTETYQIFRHPEGGRKDVIRWTQGDRPIAELETYRPDGEFSQSGPTVAAIRLVVPRRLIAGPAPLKRGSCAAAVTRPRRSVGWVTGPENPRLRGTP